MAKISATKKSKNSAVPAPTPLQATSKSIGKTKKKNKKRQESLESVIRTQHIVDSVKNQKSDLTYVIKKKKAR
jgi:hypothetical protein